MESNGNEKYNELIPNSHTQGHSDEDTMKQNTELQEETLQEGLLVLLHCRQRWVAVRITVSFLRRSSAYIGLKLSRVIFASFNPVEVGILLSHSLKFSTSAVRTPVQMTNVIITLKGEISNEQLTIV